MIIWEGLFRWFTIWWYKYLFRKTDHLDQPEPGFKGWIERIICRAEGHSCGIVYYNFNGLEPDNHCKNCGDELG